MTAASPGAHPLPAVLLAVALAGGLPITGGSTSDGETTTLIEDSFEEGLNETTFPSSSGVAVASACGATNGKHAAAAGGNTARRHLASRPFDADAGATISFTFTAGGQEAGDAESCPPIDNSSQAPIVQYSNDGGTTWHRLAQLPDSTDGFVNEQLRIDANEGSERTRLRWVQHVHDGDDEDRWAIDDVTVTTAQDAADPVLEPGDTNLGGLGPAGYAFRQLVEVTNDGEPLTDPTLELTLDTATLIEEGKLQADCDDLRFVANYEAARLLDHKVANGCGTATTTVWIDVPSLPSGSSGLVLYFGDRYGGSDAPVDPVAEPETAEAVSTSLGTEHDLTGTADEDGDSVPDRLEVTLCSTREAFELIWSGSNVGACPESSDYQPQPTDFAYTIRVPQWTNDGPDRDGDGVPDTLAIEWLHVAFPGAAGSPVVWNGGTTVHDLDLAPQDETRPQGEQACVVIARQTAITFNGGDDDGDGVPHEVQNHGADVCMKRGERSSLDVGTIERTRVWELDPDDLDPSNPQTSLPSADAIPKKAHWSPDGDADGLPARGVLDQIQVTWDRQRAERNLAPIDRAAIWDPDDRDPGTPIGAPVDTDGDHVPETNELHACDTQHPRTGLDGFCTDLGTNYHPPSRYPTSFQAIASIP